MPFAWLAITLPLLLLLQRWIHRHLRGVAYLLTGRMNWAILIYAIILFPGVALHELSHFVTARLLGVRTGSISLLPQRKQDGTLQLGYVEYYKGRSTGPLSESLIGGAPLLVGTAVVLLIGYNVFDLPGLSSAILNTNIEQFTAAISGIYTAPDFLAWLYLIFAVSNAMMPSPSDRRAWPMLIIILAVAVLIVFVLDLQQALIEGLAQPIVSAVGYLALAFTLSIGVDIVFMMLIFVVEGLVSRLRGVELLYENRETTRQAG